MFHAIQAVLPDMLDDGWGRVVNISSSSTHSGTPMKSHYVAAKSAVNGLTKSLALEYGPKGVTVNAVPPGFVDTPTLRNAPQRGDFGRHTLDDLVAATPVRRIGRPEDIAATCAFLISEEAGYVTGQYLASTVGETRSDLLAGGSIRHLSEKSRPERVAGQGRRSRGPDVEVGKKGSVT